HSRTRQPGTPSRLPYKTRRAGPVASLPCVLPHLPREASQECRNGTTARSEPAASEDTGRARRRGGGRAATAEAGGGRAPGDRCRQAETHRKPPSRAHAVITVPALTLNNGVELPAPPLRATFSINSLCHFYGRRPFATDDHSRNLAWLAPIA